MVSSSGGGGLLEPWQRLGSWDGERHRGRATASQRSDVAQPAFSKFYFGNSETKKSLEFAGCYKISMSIFILEAYNFIWEMLDLFWKSPNMFYVYVGIHPKNQSFWR